MRRIILLSLFVLFVSDASAQRGRGGGAGSGRGGFSRGGFQQGPFRGGFGRGYGYNRGGFFPYGFDYGDYGSYGFSPYNAGAPYGYSPPPYLVVQQPPSPAREANPVVTDYPQPTPEPSASPQAQAQTFGIVLKDGSIRSAIAVVVMAPDGVLHYVDTEERNVRISISEVDREATRKLNRERNLTLWLPAAPQASAAPAPGR